MPFHGTDVAHHVAFVDGVFDRLGDIDLVIVAAGVLGDGSRRRTVSLAAAAAVMTTNYTGPAAAMLAGPADSATRGTVG